MRSVEEFWEAVEKAWDILSSLAKEDEKRGTITALSYCELQVYGPRDRLPGWLVRDLIESGVADWCDLGSAIIICTYNGKFNGSPKPEVVRLGEVAGDKWGITRHPVFWIQEDRGIVTGAEGMGPVLELFKDTSAY